MESVNSPGRSRSKQIWYLDGITWFAPPAKADKHPGQLLSQSMSCEGHLVISDNKACMLVQEWIQNSCRVSYATGKTELRKWPYWNKINSRYLKVNCIMFSRGHRAHINISIYNGSFSLPGNARKTESPFYGICTLVFSPMRSWPLSLASLIREVTFIGPGSST